jgi:hypothetical protein
VLLLRLEKFNEAIEILRGVYDIKKSPGVLGPTNSSTLVTLRALYLVYRGQALALKARGDLITSEQCQALYWEHALRAAELQMERVGGPTGSGPGSLFADYEVTTEFASFGRNLTECAAIAEERTDPLRLRKLELFMSELSPSPVVNLTQELRLSRELMAEYLR